MSSAIQQQNAITEYMKRGDVLRKVVELVKDEGRARRILQTVLLVVAESPEGTYSLANATPQSILKATLNAISLGVSLSPADKQAYLVARKNGKTHAIEASLQLSYHEEKARRLRTNQFWSINVAPVYEGTEVLVNPFSGVHCLKVNGLVIAVDNMQQAFVSLKDYSQTGNVIGYLGVAIPKRWDAITVYATTAEIEAHVAKYNPYWSASFFWKNSKEQMLMKTVLRMLMAKLPPGISSDDVYPDDDNDVVDPTAFDDNADDAGNLGNEKTKRGDAAILAELGFGEPQTEGVA